MVNKPKNIGTAAETAVVRTLRRLGWPNAERRALTGSLDQGDITGCPGLVWEIKGGAMAKTASDGQVEKWLIETETERKNAGADRGILVLQRAGIGAPNAERWWAIETSLHIGELGGAVITTRMTLLDKCNQLAVDGYGDIVNRE